MLLWGVVLSTCLRLSEARHKIVVANVTYDEEWYARESALWTDATCPRCPKCLSHFHQGCLPREAFVRTHKDCRNTTLPFCSRGVYECGNSGFFFTHPKMTSTELTSLYAASYHAQKLLTADSPRIVAQSKYIREHVMGLDSLKTIVEVGCADGFLLQQALKENPGGTIVCFEPTASAAAKARENIRGNVAESTWNASQPLLKEADDGAAGSIGGNVHVVESMWDANHPLLKDGIDLFLSSHVLEHMPDLCEFLADLHAKMNPGGFVFTELPNHSREYLMQRFGGKFHISMPDQYGLHSLMRSAGFSLVDESVYGNDGKNQTLVRGWHTRSIFAKDPLVTQGDQVELDNPLDNPDHRR